MRRALASTSRSCCASCCAQRRAGAPLATAAARTYSTTRSTPRVPPQKQARPNQHHSTQYRWLSSQPQPEAVEEAQQQQDQSQPHEHTKRLPFYDLFPETLPQGPPPQGPFDIDVRALRREFLRLQAASHPDYFHAAASASNSSSSSSSQDGNDSAAAKRRRQAEAASSHINAAYKTLSHPLLRAQYILAERYGVDLAGDEAGSHAGGAGGAAADPALLIEVLEAREAIDEAESEVDLEGPMAENEERIERCVEGLRQAFAEGDIDGAVQEAVRLRYWESIKEGIRGWEKGVGGGLLHH